MPHTNDKPSRGAKPGRKGGKNMAALRNVCNLYKGDVEDGIGWVAFWRKGRSWDAEAFYQEGGDYDVGYIFTAEDVERMREILKEDGKAVMLNGYYTNCGAHEDKSVPVAQIVNGVEWNYYNRYNQLSAFYDDMVIKAENAG